MRKPLKTNANLWSSIKRRCSPMDTHWLKSTDNKISNLTSAKQHAQMHAQTPEHLCAVSTNVIQPHSNKAELDRLLLLKCISREASTVGLAQLLQRRLIKVQLRQQMRACACRGGTGVPHTATLLRLLTLADPWRIQKQCHPFYTFTCPCPCPCPCPSQCSSCQYPSKGYLRPLRCVELLGDTVCNLPCNLPPPPPPVRHLLLLPPPTPCFGTNSWRVGGWRGPAGCTSGCH